MKVIWYMGYLCHNKNEQKKIYSVEQKQYFRHERHPKPSILPLRNLTCLVPLSDYQLIFTFVSLFLQI